MEGRRIRRFGRSQIQSILPLRSAQHRSTTVSCWYCDLKISSFNQSLFRLGQRYARFFQMWFTVGIGFTLSALLGVTMILCLESARILWQNDRSNKLDDLLSSLIFGFSPSVLGLSISFIDVACLLVSTIMSVIVHEFGHAVAAASEGIQVEYIAIFMAVLFPGALVAFDNDALLAKPRKISLRIYCAGIWHNAVFCAACGLVLLLLPFFLSPLYVHGEGPMVLDISSKSPLSDYLSPGDTIVSLDSLKIRDAQEWIQLAGLIDKQSRDHPTSASDWRSSVMMNRPRGHCVPSSLVEKSRKTRLIINEPACPNELNAFVTLPCYGSSLHRDRRADKQTINETMYCMNAYDIVRFNACDGLMTTNDYEISCMCSKDEVCLSPAQLPGVAWVEIAYKKPYSQGCLNNKQNLTTSQSSEHGNTCERSFLYVGDMISMAHSLKLTAYRPRSALVFGAYLPYLIEKFLMCTFNVSLTLALLNSLPVYFLDGEAILDVSFCYLTLLSPRKRRILLQACLIVGSVFSCLVFFTNFVFRIV
ncbi:hypothetical protein V2J09_016829 [Rumex salicifolius]